MPVETKKWEAGMKLGGWEQARAGAGVPSPTLQRLLSNAPPPLACPVPRDRALVSRAFCSTCSSSALLLGNQFLFVLKLVTYKRPFMCIVVPQ